MRLLLWLLCAAAAMVPVTSSEENSVARPKRASSEKKVVCYYTNWSVYRPGTAKFSPQNINPYLCTHLIYAFGGLSKENALKPFDKYQDIEQGGYAKFNGLKTYNKNLKTMLAIGGWNEGSARFSPLVADAERRRELVKNTVKFLRQNHFDGLDLDWEYPSFRDGGKPRDRDNYATLVQEFREEFERESEKTGRPRLLLTMAVPAGIEYIDKGYDVPKLNKYLDWYNILSYDYHSAFEPAINHHSPLFSLEEDDEYNFDAQLNIDHTIQHYIKLGADRSKLVLGIPTYGRSYSLFNPDATEIGSPADGPGEQGEATREKGYLAYYEICERVKSGGWTVKNPNPEAMGPYAYKDNQWVGYDDEDIVRAKAKYVNDNDLGGIMFWSIDNDDFRGKCHGKPYPLIEAAKEALLATSNELIPTRTRSESSRSSSKKQEETSSKPKTRKTRLRTKSSTTTESSKAKDSGRTSTTPQPPTTPDPGSDFVCKDEGFFPHPRDCKKYFWCLDSGPSSLGIVAHQFTCPSGLVFNKISDSCDYARNVICKTKSETTTTTTTSTTSTTARTTTIRNRLVITASPPRTTSTTTTEQPEEEEEDKSEEHEEDPGTIKELINLIKKLGGVEQLEKQLNLQNTEGNEKIKPSLYSRVLQGRTANRYRGFTREQEATEEQKSTPKYVTLFRNRPNVPQGPSTEETSTSTRGAEKLRYVNIQKNRATKKPVPVEEETEEEEDVEEETEKPKQKLETPRPFRRRPSTDTTTKKEYVVLNRSRTPKEEEITTSRYKNIVRTRSTTEAPAEEEEEEEEEEEDEEEEGKEEEEEAQSEAEEEEVVEEEEKKEVEPGQKLKKYSSIIRNNKKKVSDEEESKVSGPQGSQFVSGAPSSTTDSTLEERNNVNNVNTVTRHKYVEIRRTTPTLLDSSINDVNIVNNLSENDRVNKEIQTETNEVSHNEAEEKEAPVNGFQRRITTELVRKPTRPSVRFSTLERTTPISVEPTKKDEFPSFVGRFRTHITTESTSGPETKSFTRYRTINRANADKPILTNENEQEQPPRRDRFRSTTVTTTSSTTEKNVNVEQKRFQFAPRSKPTILQPKPLESTTESFKITVPDLVDPSLTENILGLSNSPIPSATLEPATATAPSIVDSTIFDATENDITLTTFNEKFSPSSKQYVVPTTSTETTIVTSITESSFTERKRISVPKKDRYKSDTSIRFTSPIVTIQETEETTKPLYRQSSFKARTRSTTQAPETTTEGKRRRFKFKSTTTTTTTTEEPAPQKKYVPKKLRTFKKIVSTEAPEVVSSTTEGTRFQPRNKLRQTEGNPNNSLFSRFKSGRRKNILFKKEQEEEQEDDDDLVVEQSATFFGDDIENNDRYILGGGLKQTSEKDYLNADVFFKTVPTVEEEERESTKGDEELINSLELTKIGNPPSYTNNKTIPTDTNVPIRNRFVTVNPSLRNLRTRTRQPVESKTESTDAAKTPTERVAPKNNFYTPNRNVGIRTLRGRNQLNSNQGEKEPANDISVQNIDTKEPVNDKVVGSSPSVSNFKLQRNKTPVAEETVSDKTAEKIGAERGFGTKQPNRFNFNTPTPNPSNFRSLRTGSQQEKEFSTEPTTGNSEEEKKLAEPIRNNFYSPKARNPSSRFNANKIAAGNENVSYKSNEENNSKKRFETTEQNNSNQRSRFSRGRNQQRNEILAEEGSPVDDSNVVKRTKPGDSYQNNAGYRVRNFRNRTEQTVKATEATVGSTLGNTRQERNFRNLRTQTNERSNEKTTETLLSPSSGRSTRRPTSSFPSSQSRFRTSTRSRPEDSSSEGATLTSTFEVSSAKEPIANNLVITRFEEDILRYQTEQQILRNRSEANGSSPGTTANTPSPSTFGTRIIYDLGSTVSLLEETTTETPTTFGAKITNTIGSSTRTSSPSSYSSSSSLGSTANTVADSAFSSSISSSVGSSAGPGFGSSVRTTAGSTTGTIVRSSIDNTIRSGSTKNTFSSVNTTPSSVRTLRTRARLNNLLEPTRPGAVDAVTEEPTVSSVVVSNSSPSNFRSFKTRGRQNFTAVTPDSKLAAEEPQEPVLSNIIPPNGGQSNFRVLRTRTRVKVNSTDPLDQTAVKSSLEETTESGRNKFPKDRRRVLVRARPVQPTLETKEREDNEIESPEESLGTNSRVTSGKKGTQEYFNNLRTRGRSTTQSPVTSERTERRRTQLDRRRFRTETRTTATTLKPEVQTENSVSTAKSSSLRRRIRPTTSTTTTTEEPYAEQEDSSLEESKTGEETPGIQDLTDPAVVAIHNLAKVSPGPIAPVVTSVSSYSESPVTYTIHVTPSDLASFTTPGRIASVTPASASPRPTPILTLKPFTVPSVTKQFVAKQTPVPVRTPSPFRGTGISLATGEPFIPQGEVVVQSRRPETTQRVKVPTSVVATVPQRVPSSKPKRVKPFSKVPKQEAVQSVNSPEPPVDYEYYDDDEDPLANIPASALKVKVHSDGYIECFDRGNFPHPFSCKKFISCAKMENNELLGWEYTCPKHLSFDPVGGICNWSAGLGCQH